MLRRSASSYSQKELGENPIEPFAEDLIKCETVHFSRDINLRLR